MRLVAMYQGWKEKNGQKQRNQKKSKLEKWKVCVRELVSFPLADRRRGHQS